MLAMIGSSLTPLTRDSPPGLIMACTYMLQMLHAHSPNHNRPGRAMTFHDLEYTTQQR